MATDCQVTIADGTVAEVIVCLRKILVSFGTMLVSLGFLVVRNAPFDAIFCGPPLESMQAILDFGRQQVTLAVGRKFCFYCYPVNPQ